MSDLPSRCDLARACGREPTTAERIADVMDNESIYQLIANGYDWPCPVPTPDGRAAWEKLCDDCCRLSAKEEGMTLADYCRLNNRPIPGQTWDTNLDDEREEWQP